MLHFKIEDLLADAEIVTPVHRRLPERSDSADYRAAIDRLTTAALQAYRRYYSTSHPGETPRPTGELGLSSGRTSGALTALRAVRGRAERSADDRV
jgi:hypothetical protein